MAGIQLGDKVRIVQAKAQTRDGKWRFRPQCMKGRVAGKPVALALPLDGWVSSMGEAGEATVLVGTNTADGTFYAWVPEAYLEPSSGT